MKAATASEGALVRTPSPVGRALRGLLSFMRRKPLGAVGLVLVAFMVFVAVFAPLIRPFDPNQMSREFLQAPSFNHPFGTDRGGRDQLSRVMSGAWVSIYVGFAAVLLSGAIGVVVGIGSAYAGGKTDLVVQRLVDVLQAFPTLILAMALVAGMGSSLNTVVFAIAVGLSPRMVRVMRSAALSVRESPFVEAARALGASPMRIMARHIFINCTAPLMIMAAALLGSAIVTEATLSFLELGIPPPQPSWGRMITGAAREFAEKAPWMVVFPGVALALTVYGSNVLADAVRDVWDPRLRGA